MEAKGLAMGSLQELQRLAIEVADTPKSVEMELRVQLASAIIRMLKRHGWTQHQLALKAEMQDSQISELVHADENCTLETVGRVLFALGARGSLVEVVETETDPSGLATIWIEGTNGQEIEWSEIEAAAGWWTKAISAATRTRPIGTTRDVGRLDAHRDAQKRTSRYVDIRGSVSRRFAAAGKTTWHHGRGFQTLHAH